MSIVGEFRRFATSAKCVFGACCGHACGFRVPGRSFIDVGWLLFANAGRELSSEVLVESLSVPFGSLGADEPSGASFSTAEASAVVVAVSSFGGMLPSSALAASDAGEPPVASCPSPLFEAPAAAPARPSANCPVICRGEANNKKVKTLPDARAESVERGNDFPTRHEWTRDRPPSLCARTPTDH